MKEKLKYYLKKIVLFIVNPRLLLCLGLGWMITNGWSYILFALGTWLKSGWMLAVSGAYLTFLWLPISPEKIITVAIAMWLLKVLFPNDEKTLGVLKDMYAKIKQTISKKKDQAEDNSEPTMEEK
ncbi:MAG: hypothetical protein IJW14_04860 [Oscillospiraceae bacterium]|nr:hypothetical protein [Oscillospiraceae bacterium]